MQDDLYLSNYDYLLDEKMIARYPLEDKGAAKLLVYDASSKEISHLHFANLPDILPPCDIFFNDTKVVKARLYSHKESGAKREIFIHEFFDDYVVAQVKGRVREGERLFLLDSFFAEVLSKCGERRKLCFKKEGKKLKRAELLELLSTQGHIPLPPYLKREDETQDERDYQSIFAKNEGAVAAPTASLHFCDTLLARLKQKHKTHTLTLHVGAGTFKSVSCDNIKDHVMHSEYFKINPSEASVIASKTPILSVGTTVTRTVEYYARTGLLSGLCDLFLNPLNKPIRVNHLLTNFHLPKSTLIMLVASFIGRKETLRLYEEAKAKNYRFYSYGDAMLILNHFKT